MKKAVLLITFNRLETTKVVFEQIAIAKPPRLYISSDGAREDKEDEREKVEDVRRWLLENITWECELKTRFLSKNSGGCGHGVSSAVSWFFENEEDGIILEDDTVPHQSFFRFCEDLLDKYKDDKRIWHIAGYNPCGIMYTQTSYFFHTLMFCWGWATWKDRWMPHFTLSLKEYPVDAISFVSKNKVIQDYYRKILLRMQSDKPIDTWDYQWSFMLFKQNALCVVPTKNLISNIGISGVHYQNAATDPRLRMQTYNIFEDKELTPPPEIKIDKDNSLKLFKKSLPHLSILTQEESLDCLQKELALQKELIIQQDLHVLTQKELLGYLQKELALQKEIIIQQDKLISQVALRQKFSYIRYYKYKILRKLVWGKTRKSYKEKYKNMKEIKRKFRKEIGR